MTRRDVILRAAAVGAASIFVGALLGLRREDRIQARADALSPRAGGAVLGGDGPYCGVDFGAAHASVVWTTHGPDGVVRIVDEYHVHTPDDVARLREQIGRRPR
jgi:hypothetical protein